MYLEPVGHHLAIRDGVQHLDRLLSSVGGSDVSGHRYPVGKLQGSGFVSIWEPGPLKVFDEARHLHTKPSQLGVDAVLDGDGLSELAACYESWVVVDLHELDGLVVDEEPQSSHDHRSALLDTEASSHLGRSRDGGNLDEFLLRRVALLADLGVETSPPCPLVTSVVLRGQG